MEPLGIKKHLELNIPPEVIYIGSAVVIILISFFAAIVYSQRIGTAGNSEVSPSPTNNLFLNMNQKPEVKGVSQTNKFFGPSVPIKSPSPTPKASPTSSPTATPAPTQTPTPTSTPNPTSNSSQSNSTPTPTQSPVPTASPTPTPTATPSPSPTPSPTIEPSPTPQSS